MWKPKLILREPGTQGVHVPFICPRCKAPAEIWFESFKGGGTYMKVRHTEERHFTDGAIVASHRCYIK